MRANRMAAWTGYTFERRVIANPAKKVDEYHNPFIMGWKIYYNGNEITTKLTIKEVSQWFGFKVTKG